MHLCDNSCQMSPFQIWLRSVYQPRHHRHSAPELSSLDRWTSPQMGCKGVEFCTPFPIVTLITDVSTADWRPNLKHLQIQGMWFWKRLLLHISVLELQTIWLACRAFLLLLKRITVQILADHSTATCSIKRQWVPVKKQQKWCHLDGITPMALHLRGPNNYLVNYLSRQVLCQPRVVAEVIYSQACIPQMRLPCDRPISHQQEQMHPFPLQNRYQLRVPLGCFSHPLVSGQPLVDWTPHHCRRIDRVH